MLVLRSLGRFAVAALAEIGGAWSVWQGIRHEQGWPWVVLGGAVCLLGMAVIMYAPRGVTATQGRISSRW